jgi:hypothetical protein
MIDTLTLLKSPPADRKVFWPERFRSLDADEGKRDPGVELREMRILRNVAGPSTNSQMEF